MRVDEITIPEEIQKICRDLARVAKQSGLTTFSGTFRAGYELSKWTGDISFKWESGRHGEDSNQLSIHSQFWVNIKVDIKDVPVDGKNTDQ